MDQTDRKRFQFFVDELRFALYVAPGNLCNY